MHEDVDGLPLDLDIDGAPIDDIDGAPLEGNGIDDIDGIPMHMKEEEDIDGIPLGSDAAKPKLIKSKWEEVDPTQLEAQGMLYS